MEGAKPMPETTPLPLTREEREHFERLCARYRSTMVVASLVSFAERFDKRVAQLEADLRRFDATLGRVAISTLEERNAQLEAELAQVRAQLETALVHSNFWEEQAARNARTIMDCGGLLDVTPGALAGGFLYDRISKLIANEHACQRRAERLQEDLERAIATGTPPAAKAPREAGETKG